MLKYSYVLSPRLCTQVIKRSTPSYTKTRTKTVMPAEIPEFHPRLVSNRPIVSSETPSPLIPGSQNVVPRLLPLFLAGVFSTPQSWRFRYAQCTQTWTHWNSRHRVELSRSVNSRRCAAIPGTFQVSAAPAGSLARLRLALIDACYYWFHCCSSVDLGVIISIIGDGIRCGSRRFLISRWIVVVAAGGWQMAHVV